MKHIILSTFMAASLLTAVPALADKSGYYKWTDDSGAEHFTQQPPTGRQYQYVETGSGLRYDNSAPEQNADGSPAEAASEPDSDESSKPLQAEVLPPKNPEYCAQAKSNIGTLSLSGARIRVQGDDGGYRFLTPAEKADRLQQARDLAELYCE